MVIARSNGRPRQDQRISYLYNLLREVHPDLTDAEIRAAFGRVVSQSESTWRTHHATPTTHDIVCALWSELGVEVDQRHQAETVRIFQEGILHFPPEPVAGLAGALEWAAGRYRLGLISDTMFSPGRVICELLDRFGILRHFSAFVFSDEVGFSKPDVRAFRQAAAALGTTPSDTAHIGDLHRTDIAGAREAGALAILFTGVHYDDEATPEPDLVLNHWHDLPRLL